MCDEFTEAENEAFLKRREFALGAGATVAALVAGCVPDKATGETSTPPDAGAGAAAEEDTAAQATGGPSVIGKDVAIPTPDGEAEAFFVAPSEGGPRPAVLIWPDIAGLRGAFRSMAEHLAESGYAVLAVNHYYRSSPLPILKEFSEWRTPEGREKIRPMREALSPEAIVRDAQAFVAWLDQQSEVDTNARVGTTGYCMGGPFTFRTAAAVPERIGALGSFHGGGLATEEENSPHRLFPKMEAAALICIAANDDERDPEAKNTLEAAAREAGRSAEIEVYPAPHGWCVTDSPVYDEVQANRAWDRLLATFQENL